MPNIEKMELESYWSQLKTDVKRLVDKRPAEFDIAQNEEICRRYRELLLTTPGLSKETLLKTTGDDVPLADVLRRSGILDRIKVAQGAKAPVARHAARCNTWSTLGQYGFAVETEGPPP